MPRELVFREVGPSDYDGCPTPVSSNGLMVVQEKYEDFDTRDIDPYVDRDTELRRLLNGEIN